MSNKICSKCEEAKPLSEFYFVGVLPESQCKLCRTTAMAAAKQRHLDNNQVVNTDGVKTCTSCQSTKPKTDFAIKRSSPDGLNPWCKACHKEYQRNYYQSPAGQLSYRLGGAKDRAKKLNRTFGLDREFIFDLWEKQNGLCALTGIPIDTEASGTPESYGPFSLSIDRIDSKRGYEKDNVRLTVLIANMTKSVWSDEDLLNFSLRWLTSQGYSVNKIEGGDQ